MEWLKRFNDWCTNTMPYVWSALVFLIISTGLLGILVMVISKLIAWITIGG